MKYFWILLLTPLLAQTTFTQEEALKMIKERDAQWEGKIAQCEELVDAKTEEISVYEGLVNKMEKQANVDSLLLVAKDKQIDLLKVRDEANEKMVKLVKSKWYENQYLWLGIGFVLGKM
jgi:hypothetical protein